MDLIYLNGLELKCTIGVWDWEQAIQQTLHADVQVGTNTSLPAKTDDLADAVDYHKMTVRLQEVAKAQNYALLETLAEKIADCVLTEFATDYVKIKLDKGAAVKGVRHVGVIIERKSAHR
ncbi:7,8-dihydroneopterin aldolase [Arenicella chitinivorans]|uniref:Dihydroneopterin aldolase n=1 Tax=Arenicella chitinivorans TaxID=1329800 RepID=A0A918RXX5_9GAMM|nr:dihydroneopterin aldolase [Arenicella chitinivorans]GHA13612.1 7,8-dihydroneopterin aldolase [Arenicella chitinivorans]